MRAGDGHAPSPLSRRRGAWRNPLDLVRLQVTLGVSGRFSALPFSGFALGRYLRSAMGRRLVFHQLLERGDRMSVTEAADLLADARECTCSLPLLKAGRRDGQIAQLSPRTCPIRVVWGRRDRVIPYARYGRPLLHRVTGVEQVSLHGAGHVPMWDAPTLLRSLILDLTGSVEAVPTEGVVP